MKRPELARLRAGCELSFDIDRETPVVMMLQARAGDPGQHIIEERIESSQAVPMSAYIDGFGNSCRRFTAHAGVLQLQVHTLVDVSATVIVDRDAPRTPVPRVPNALLPYMLPSRYCPSDRLLQLALDVTRECEPGYAQVQAIRDYVHDRLDYRYGVSNSSTDACETLTMGAGVCRDFSHVAISLCRSLDIPARMAVGYLHRLEPMDLHAWFEAYVGGRWYTFDATEEILRGGRIVLAYGRDAAEVAFITDYGALRTRSMRVWVEEVAQAKLPVPAGLAIEDAAE